MPLFFGRCEKDENRRLSQEFLALLGQQGVRHIADAYAKCGIFEHRGEWWTIADNGGEINIERVNYPDSIRSLPYIFDTHNALDTMTLLCWTMAALDGKKSWDWSWRANEGSVIYGPVEMADLQEIWRA